MSEQPDPSHSVGAQRAQGNQIVQVQGVAAGASVQVTFSGQRRRVPLRKAVVPVGPGVSSPARLMRASSGVLPFVERDGLLAGLKAWIADGQAFSTYLVGGRGGSGKTRLGVHLCQLAEQQGWKCGVLEDDAEQGGVEALANESTGHLVVIDYAETRPERLAALLPALADGASAEHPVKVLLLVRSGAREGDWCAALRGHGDQLDAVLDDTKVQVLDDQALSAQERAELFTATATAFARREQPDLDADALSPPAPALEGPTFDTALMVVVAAYLAAHGAEHLPTTRQGLLAGLTEHEDRYWCFTATRENLGLNKVMRARVVATATLTGAADEQEASDLLLALPVLSGSTAERRANLAQWIHDLYPGPRWWNPLEPDLLGEYLVATHLSAYPGLLARALQRREPAALIQPLNLYARAAADHPALATAMTQVLTTALPVLCRTAVAQAAAYTDLTSLTGASTIATALQRAVSTIALDAIILPEALSTLPARPDLILGPLALTLTDQFVSVLQRLAEVDPATYEPNLASALGNLSNRLSNAGRHDEALTAIEKAVDIEQRLALTDPTAHEPGLASSLNNYSLCLFEFGLPQAVTAAKQAVDIYQRLALADPAAYEPHFAASLSNQSNCLSGARHYDQAVTAAKQAVDIYQRLALADPAAYEPHFAASLNNHSNCLSDAGHYTQALAPIEQAVIIRRCLAKINPAAYEFYLATSLNNYSNRLSELKRHPEALTAIEQAVTIYQHLAQANPRAYMPRFISSLRNCAKRLFELGRHSAAKQVEEEVDRLLRENGLT